ncbi:MAG: iron ABC transporter permease [Chloroflexi bacterium]|nr:iron ABC transporter permease [Chloroflexota bacterium]
MALVPDEVKELALSSRRWTPFSGLPPVVVWAPAVLVASAAALPLLYLLIRTVGVGEELPDMLFRWRTAGVLLRSAALVGGVTTGAVAMAVPLAWLTVRTDIPLRRMWSVATVLPLVIPSYVAAFLAVVALGPKGMLQGWLAPLGVERLPEIYGYPGAAVTLVLLTYPYVLLSVRGALGRLDPALEETSRSLGVGRWETFCLVILPLLRPSIAGGALLVALYTLSDFGAVSILRYETFTWAIYIQYDGALDRTLAAALSLVLITVALAILIVEGRVRGRAQYYRSTAGAVRPPGVVRLGRWKWAAVALMSGVVGVSVVLPMGVLGYWVVRGLAAGEALQFLWQDAFNSVYVSLVAALVAVAAALPVAGLVVRHQGRMSSVVEKLTYTGFALPGIVVALALVFLGVRYLTPIYQTVIMLVFAYVVLFLPTAVNTLRASLLQVSPSVEEAARCLGKSPLGVMATVTLPLLRPGFVAGAAIVFLLAMKELPATLILSPIGFTTLATSIWSATSEAFFARAAVPSLLLILVTAFPLVWLLRRGEG